MNQLAEKRAIVAGEPERDGDIVWSVTEAGVEEAPRVSQFYGGTR